MDKLCAQIQRFNFINDELRVIEPSMETDFREGVAAYLVVTTSQLTNKNISDAKRTMWFRGEKYANQLISQFK